MYSVFLVLVKHEALVVIPVIIAVQQTTPKFSGIKKSFYYVHDSVGQEFKQGTVGKVYYSVL